MEWNFWGITFGPEIFWGFVGSTRDLLGFRILPHSITDPRHLKSIVRPSPYLPGATVGNTNDKMEDMLVKTMSSRIAVGSFCFSRVCVCAGLH